jgi:hypothetical protein
MFPKLFDAPHDGAEPEPTQVAAKHRGLRLEVLACASGGRRKWTLEVEANTHRRLERLELLDAAADHARERNCAANRPADPPHHASHVPSAFAWFPT